VTRDNEIIISIITIIIIITIYAGKLLTNIQQAILTSVSNSDKWRHSHQQNVTHHEHAYENTTRPISVLV
jgi:hypothetical protein